MSVSHGHSTIGGIERWLWRSQKERKMVSHQLGVSMGYGDAHRLKLMQGVGIAMQRMHYSYKYMKAQEKKLSGCASNLLAHEDLGHLRRPIVGIYKPSSIIKNSTSI